MSDDAAHMAAALALARRGLGRTWPNPSVGCVIARDGWVLARGRTADGGRPHAEASALAAAREAGSGDALRGATAYVTLEPCSHHGHTPPCANALVEAGVTRVVVATGDPDSRVAGRGLARLRAAGIDVLEGVGRAEADEINAGFFMRVRAGRPLIALKTATSLDGRIATATGDSKWITGPAARAEGHLLRATHDAIMVGIGTVRADDPELTCRLPGLGDRSPIRVILDSRARLRVDSKLALDARGTPVWLLCGEGVSNRRITTLSRAGVDVRLVPVGTDGRVDIATACRDLGEAGLTRVLVEGGGKLAASLLAAGLVDRIVAFRGGVVIGGDGLPSVASMRIAELGSAPRFERVSSRVVGDDTLETWARRA